MAVGDDMLAEVTPRLVLHLNQGFLKHRPAEYVDTHGCKVASRHWGLLFKFHDTVGLICYHDTKTACFLNRYRHTGNRHIRFIRFMEIKHYFIIHLIDMVAG